LGIFLRVKFKFPRQFSIPKSILNPQFAAHFNPQALAETALKLAFATKKELNVLQFFSSADQVQVQDPQTMTRETYSKNLHRSILN
jgi:hypothetical protein